jgi:glycosyltransferase involved in cell wall biosynthesis
MRLAIVASHPIQYQVPLFRRLASSVELTVFFCHRHGLGPSFDPGFGRSIQYDVPLLEGYESRFLPNLSMRPGPRPLGMINPTVVRLFGEHDAVVINGYSTVTGLLALAAPKTRAAVLFRGESNLLPRRSRATRVVKDVVLKRLFRRVDHFLAIGSLNRDYYVSFGVPSERISIAPYSVDNDYFAQRSQAAQADRAAARRRLGIPTEGPLFLYVAKLLPRKRPLDLIRAFIQASDAGMAQLALVGDGELMPEVQALRSGSSVRDQIHLLGFRNQSELPEIYGASDVLVLPSDLEPWGLVVNEAMACGAVPVVSDQVGAGPDLADPTFVFPAGDVPRLAEILRRIIRDPGLVEVARRDAARKIESWGIVQTSDAILAALSVLGGGLSRSRGATSSS